MAQRVLYKAYGLRILINVNGIAKKFDILVLTISIGSGVELFAISRMFADFVLLKFVSKKKLYKNFKEIKFNNISLSEY